MTTCHLRELAEQLASNEITAPERVAIDSRVYSALDAAELAAKNAMCFHMGESSELDGFKFIPDLVRLPFSACWFEFDHTCTEGIGVFGVLAREIELNASWFIFCRPVRQKKWSIMGWASMATKTDKHIGWAIRPKGAHHDSIISVLHVVSNFLSAMNCSNVRKSENIPDQKIQRAREKRGKLPLFSFWTLALDFDYNQDDTPRGGTHASPRLHLRRGHARQYAPGKYTWVQPCAVGNKAAGMVHKDYALRPL